LLAPDFLSEGVYERGGSFACGHTHTHTHTHTYTHTHGQTHTCTGVCAIHCVLGVVFWRAWGCAYVSVREAGLVGEGGVTEAFNRNHLLASLHFFDALKFQSTGNAPYAL
jgi:hypothetical protein